jgi:effector-binding domain-containing protein
VKSSVSPAELRNMLLLKRNDVEQTLAVEAQRLRYIETRIVQLESEDEFSAEDVVMRSEPARRFLSLRRNVTSFSAARELIAELRTLARPLLPKGRQHALIAVAHSPQFELDDIDVEFGFAIGEEFKQALPADSILRLRELEAVKCMAVCVRVGLPENAHLVTARIGRFLEISGDELAGPSREFFLQPPDPDRMHESVVEMQFPVRRRSLAPGPQPG